MLFSNTSPGKTELHDRLLPRLNSRDKTEFVIWQVKSKPCPVWRYAVLEDPTLPICARRQEYVAGWRTLWTWGALGLLAVQLSWAGAWKRTRERAFDYWYTVSCATKLFRLFHWQTCYLCSISDINLTNLLFVQYQWYLPDKPVVCAVSVIFTWEKPVVCAVSVIFTWVAAWDVDKPAFSVADWCCKLGLHIPYPAEIQPGLSIHGDTGHPTEMKSHKVTTVSSCNSKKLGANWMTGMGGDRREGNGRERPYGWKDIQL